MMATYAFIGAGLLWTLTYILIIDRGFKDQTYGMPLIALCANISWEGIFVFIYPHEMPQLQINRIWFFFDTIIVFQYLKFGPTEFHLPRHWFYPLFLVTLITSFCCVLFVTYELNDWGGAYTSLGSNLMMSVLFIAMLLHRQSLRGQSIAIAVAKLLGTLLASVGLYLAASHRQSILMLFLSVAILVFDLIYIVMVLTAWRKVKLSIALPSLHSTDTPAL
jgi:hypothetical protein